jgi:bis(5'-nucleosyl)-tetraphosphatase (symmetrical)
MRYAGEAEAVLQSPDYRDFFEKMYGNTPTAWDERLSGIERLRGIVNTFTRLRYCTPSGEFDFQHKGALGTQPVGLVPWFGAPGRASADVTCVFGHWSTLGLINQPDLIALDTGCLWGSKLTAIRLEDRQVFAVRCPQAKRPKA